MYYVYAHKRLDTDEIFYIGKGSKNRAYSKNNRNNYWFNIVNKYGYEVEILHSELEELDAFNKEIELIKTLHPVANLTKGGEGGNTFELMSTEDKEAFRLAGRERATCINSGIQIAAKIRKGQTKETHEGLKRMAEKHSISFTGINNPMYGKSHWFNKTKEEAIAIKRKISKTLKATYKSNPRIYKKVTCPHCNKTGGTPGLTRYHFDNCKYYIIV